MQLIWLTCVLMLLSHADGLAQDLYADSVYGETAKAGATLTGICTKAIYHLMRLNPIDRFYLMNTFITALFIIDQSIAIAEKNVRCVV